MRAIRRHDYSVRLEIMPLIDVIFLLLVFFIYAMVRWPQVLPFETPPLGAAGESDAPPAATIGMDRDGNYLLDGKVQTLEALMSTIIERRAESPETRIYLAADREGSTDRLPGFLALYDRLAAAEIPVSLVGTRPADD